MIKRHRFANVAIQICTSGIRFLLIFFLAKFLDPSAVGYYGLFVAAVGYGLYFIGLDFYTYTTRQVVVLPLSERGRLLKAHLVLSLLLCCVVLPAGYALLTFSGWPAQLLAWFPPLLVLEHANQEISRLLVALSHQVWSTTLTFVRQASWAVVIILLMLGIPESRNLGATLGAWALAGILAAVMGGWKLHKIGMGGWKDKIDWRHIRKGLRVSLTFLVATLAVRAIQTFDRYWFEALVGIETVGAYVLLVGVAGALLIFLDAAVFSYAYPELIRLNYAREHRSFAYVIRSVLIQSALISIAFAAISSFALPYLLDWIGKSIYQKSIYLYPWLLLSTSLFALSMAPHYGLYARGADSHIVGSHLAALFIFLFVTWAAKDVSPRLAVPAGVLAAFAAQLVWKAIAYRVTSRTLIGKVCAGA